MTFLTGLAFGVEIAIIAGVVTDILIVLYYTARPKITAENVPVSRRMF